MFPSSLAQQRHLRAIRIVTSSRPRRNIRMSCKCFSVYSLFSTSHSHSFVQSFLFWLCSTYFWWLRICLHRRNYSIFVSFSLSSFFFLPLFRSFSFDFPWQIFFFAYLNFPGFWLIPVHLLEFPGMGVFFQNFLHFITNFFAFKFVFPILSINLIPLLNVY